MKSTIKLIVNQNNFILKSRVIMVINKKLFFWNKKTTDTEKTVEKKEKPLGEMAQKDIENSQDDFKEYLSYLIKFKMFSWTDYYIILL